MSSLSPRVLRTRLQVEVLEDRSVPSVAPMPGGMGLLPPVNTPGNAPPALVLPLAGHEQGAIPQGLQPPSPPVVAPRSMPPFAAVNPGPESTPLFTLIGRESGTGSTRGTIDRQVQMALPLTSGSEKDVDDEGLEQEELQGTRRSGSAAAVLLDAKVPADFAGLDAFLAGLVQTAENAGRALGSTLPGWLFAAALTGMACELARRQMRASSPDEAAEALAGSLRLW